ncbi:MAG: hypothetical protein FWE07_08320 [Turicibacter sp.]|nr:hypothetical protein [Turicibacter sp.]
MKDISLRPTKLILSLFEQIRKCDHLPNTDRNSIVDRSIELALKNRNIDWLFISTIFVEEDGFEGNIPNHVVLKVAEEKFDAVNEQIRVAFAMEKITIPYTLKLLLVHYLSSLKQVELSPPSVSIPHEINLAVYKGEYTQSLYRNKRRLLDVCRVYLKANPSLQQNLMQRVTEQNLELNKRYDLSKYFPDDRTEMGTPTATHLAQILAGWFISLAEAQYETSLWDGILAHIIKTLEEELQMINESPLQKMGLKKDAETADYYKNVYSRMIGR